MNITEDIVREIILEVLREMEAGEQPAGSFKEGGTPLAIKEIGVARTGVTKNEVVIAVPPAFGTVMNKTIVGIPHQQVLREIIAGIEEEGIKARLVRIYRTADVGQIAHEAAKLSGSGIGIGTLSRGTTVIHQKDLKPLQNLELFSQSPLVDLELFRAIGRNAAKYAKGESPPPLRVRNDPMARPRYQGLAALLHNKETQYVNPDKKAQEVTVQL
jgi:propanediol dehydratase medium subunit